MATAPTFPNGIVSLKTNIVTANANNWITMYNNSAQSPVRVESLNVCSNDSNTVNIQFGISDGNTTFLLGTARALTLSGTDGATSRVNALNYVGTTASDSIQVIELAPGSILQTRSLANVTATKLVTVTGWGRTYA